MPWFLTMKKKEIWYEIKSTIIVLLVGCAVFYCWDSLLDFFIKKAINR